MVIPTHDRSELLAEALQSVLLQTVQDFEVIVVDDGGSTGILPVEDPRLHLIVQAHSGAAAARNKGIQAARGEFVTFLDDDDVFTPDRLQLALDGLRQAPIALCWKAALLTGDLRWCRTLIGPIAGLILEGPVPQLGSAAVRRDLVLPMEPSMRASEDVEWWLRMSEIGDVYTVPQVGYLIRDHQGVRLRDNVELRLEERLHLLSMHAMYFQDHPRAASYQWRRAAGLAGSLRLWRGALLYGARSIVVRRPRFQRRRRRYGPSEGQGGP